MIALFGGTFDPVHVGHVHAALAVCAALRLPKVRLLLSARPGHRGVPGASVAQRWAMLELACAEDARLLADDTEVRRARRFGRPSYTAETLEELKAADPAAELAWLVGSDAFLELTSWHRWRDLLTLANLVVLKRPGAALTPTGQLAALLDERQVSGQFPAAAGGIRILDTPMRDVSATAVRNALAGAAAGVEVADLLPRAVYTYIKKHHLYGVVSDA